VVIALFFTCAVALMALAATDLWQGIFSTGIQDIRGRFDSILEGIGMLTIGLVALGLSQTIFEEEIQRDVKVSGPTRVRRYLSRFLVVIVIALAIETLVAVFELMHSDPTRLPYAAAIGASAAVLLIAWGSFVHLNRSAEELEPEAMAQTKREDRKVK
jgi:hypothetical protein